jgi:hypothetical protein
VENNTDVVRNGTETSESFTLQAGESRYILLSQTEHAHLVSTKPVLLGQYFNGQGYEGANEDPAYAIIPQIESYWYKYQAATCFPQFQQHFVNLVVQKNSTSQLHLNGAPFLTANSAKAIPGTDLEAFQYQFDCAAANGKPISFTIEHKQNASFGLFAYGFSAWISYGYPGGMYLNDDVFYKCEQPQINVTASSVRSQACNLTAAVPNFDQPITWTDDECCKGNATLSYVDTVISSTSCLRKIERMWTLEDGCGRSVNASQIATIERLFDVYQAPPSDVDFNGECANVGSNATAQPNLTRNCGTTISVNFTDVTDNSTHVNRTWLIKQDCTSETFKYKQTIHCGTIPPKKKCKCPCRCRKCQHKHKKTPSP